MSYELQRTYGLDSTYWYEPENQLSPLASSLFMKLDPDLETQQFLDHSDNISGSIFWQSIRNVGCMLLSLAYSKTDINGIIGFGNMFLFSEKQMAKFLDIDQAHWDSSNKKVLDLGAGNGDITEHLRPFYNNIYATELSPMMRKRLKSKGYSVVDALNWSNSNEKYDLITAFNLLDRHYSPRTLLRDLWLKATDSNCNVVISLVLPISHYVEFNPNGKSTRPDTLLNVTGRTYAKHVHDIIVNEFEPANFEVLRWTRLPYLCEGDLNHAAYYLPDAVFLLKPKPAKSEETAESPTRAADNVVHNEL